MKLDDDRALLKTLCQHLDAGVERQDAATRSRLNRTRQLALELAEPSRSKRWGNPLLALACAALFAALALPLLAPLRQAADLPAPAFSREQDAEWLSSDADWELVQNLEFYAWLQAQSLEG